ncbi:MAG: AIR synthase-related protein, partial [Stellaceae bacterium]
MSAAIDRIYRYPVKGLSAEALDRVALSPGKCLPQDRRFAVALGTTAFDPARPAWLSKTHFVMLMRDEALARLHTRFSPQTGVLSIAENGRVVLEARLTDAEGCRQAGAVWGGGETPTLKGIVNAATIVLAGSAVGKIAPKNLRITGDVRDGDSLIFLASSGVQTNGLSLCRFIAEKLPQGYSTPLGFGDPRTYGEALLAPSVIYVAFVRECQRRGLKLNYAAHVTGHGWRKLMRLEEPFVYEITEPRAISPLFKFLMQAGPVDLREAYATFNMGVGFAAFVAPSAVDATLAAAQA